MSYKFSMLVMLLILTLGCSSKGELRSEAATDRKSAEDWRQHRDPALGKYYSDMYAKNAEEKEDRANSMSFYDEIFLFIGDSILVLIGDTD